MLHLESWLLYLFHYTRPASPDAFFFFHPVAAETMATKQRPTALTQGIHSHLLEILCRPTIPQSLHRNLHCSVNVLIYLLSLKSQCLPFLFLMALVLPQPFLTGLLQRDPPIPSCFLYLPIISREEQRIFLLTEEMAKYCNSCHAKSCRAHLSLATPRISVKKTLVGIFNPHQARALKIASGCVRSRLSHTFHSSAAPFPLTSCPLLHEKLCSPEINNSCEFKGSKWNYFSYSNQNLTQMSSEVRSLLSHHLFQD